MAFPMAAPAALAAARLARAALADLWQALAASHRMAAPVACDGVFRFQETADFAAVRLDYNTTILPAKKFFYPPVETIFRFHRHRGALAPDEEACEARRPLALFGLHGCDVRALELLDQVYTGEFSDPAYARARAETFIVALSCLEPGPSCFCTSFRSGPFPESGFDLLLTDLGGHYLVEAGSARGAGLLQQLGAEPADSEDQLLKTHRLREAVACFRRHIPTEGLPRLLNQAFQHPVWQALKDQCLSCGTCTVVCPTCYCFNVWDKVNLDLETGERKMAWDSCQLLDFGQVALGQNFRRDRAARIKQRIYHKLNYFREQYGKFGCVGCGRCVEACVKHIDPVTIVAALKGV